MHVKLLGQEIIFSPKNDKDNSDETRKRNKNRKLIRDV